MDKTIIVNLNGHPEPYPLEVAAHDRLERYLSAAEARLHDDPDKAEILADLERSVGDKLAALPGPSDRLITTADIDGVIDQIGTVDTGRAPAPEQVATGSWARIRKLRRIRKGQSIAGVCNGIAAYSEIRVDWVRTFFVLASLGTAGIFGLVYVAMAFFLPVVDQPETA